MACRGRAGGVALAAARVDHHVFVRDDHGADFHVAADHDAARPFVDHRPGDRLRLEHWQAEQLRHERHRPLFVLRRDDDFDILLVQRPSHFTASSLKAQLVVDQLGNVLGKLKIGMVLFQHQRDLSIFDEKV